MKRRNLFIKNPIWPNQKKAANRIYKEIKNGAHRAFLLSAQMQSGKTGVIAYLLKKSYANITSIKQFWVLCPENSTALREQTQKDMPSFDSWEKYDGHVKSPVEVRNNANIKDIYSKKYNAHGLRDAIVVLDECHLGNQVGSKVDEFLMTIDVDFSMSHSEVMKNLEKRNIFLVIVSATPYNAIFSESHKKVPNMFKHIRLDMGDAYYGIGDMLRAGLVHDSEKLVSDSQISHRFKNLIEQRIKMPASERNKYMVVRGQGEAQEAVEILKSKFGSKIDLILFDQEHKEAFSASRLSVKPEKPTIVLIKGFWRVGNQLDTSNVAFVWDSSTGNVDTVAQALAGRACGYNKKKDLVEIYAFKQALENFVKEATNKPLDPGIKVTRNTKISTHTVIPGEKLEKLPFELPREMRVLMNSKGAVKHVKQFLIKSRHPSIVGLLSDPRNKKKKLFVRDATKNKTRNLEANLRSPRPTAGLKNGKPINPHCVWFNFDPKTSILNLSIVRLDREKSLLNAAGFTTTQSATIYDKLA